MIQRIQSLYLLLGALALTAFFFFDGVWESNAATTYAWFEPALLILNGLAILGGLAAIFLYATRERQRRVVLGVQMITVLLLVTLYGGLFLTDELNVRTPAGLDVAMVIALLLPIVAYVFYYLARRGIEHDIKLVEDMERFRLRE